MDTLRFICALWVAIGHTSLPPWPETIRKTIPLSHYLEAVYNNLFNGPAAVVVFFVISGLVIHLPFARSKLIPSVFSFYTRRYIRIILPILSAIIFAKYIVGYQFIVFEDSILWSIWCELIYYSLYPLLLVCRRVLGSWIPLVGLAFVASFGVVLTDPGAGNYPSYGRELNWILGLPCWLLGCLAADYLSRRQLSREVGVFAIWGMRLAAITLATICSVLRFHTPIGYPWTLNVFAVFAMVWIMAEVQFYGRRSPPAYLEWLGRSSYSLYLTHMVTLFALSRFDSLATGHIEWGLLLLAMIVVSIVFWAVIEWPSHLLARSLAGRLEAIRFRSPFSNRRLTSDLD